MSELTKELDKPVELWLFRHGETLFNVKNMIQGWCDSPLTVNGMQMTKKMGTKLKNDGIVFEAAFSSDLTRCLETAEILLDCLKSPLKVCPDKRLREINTGDCEGDLVYEHLKKYPSSFNIKKHLGVPNGEEWNETLNRIISALDDIGEKYKQCGGKILIVSHSMVISALMSYLGNEEEFTPIPHNCIVKFEYYDGKLNLRGLQKDI